MNPLNHFDIRLTTQELDFIANLLAQQPWGQVNALLANIKSQVDMAQKIAQMAPVGDMHQQMELRPNGIDPTQ